MTTPAKTPSKSATNTPTKTSPKVASKVPAKTPLNLASIVETTPVVKPATKSVSKPVVATSKANAAAKKVIAKTPAVKTAALPLVKELIEKPIKAKKIKLVRDSFTIPKPEYLILDNLKLRAADLKHPVKKSELLRAGIKALAAMADAQLLLALKAVPMLKTGRPSK